MCTEVVRSAASTSSSRWEFDLLRWRWMSCLFNERTMLLWSGWLLHAMS